mgnify:CR=1 FL=1
MTEPNDPAWDITEDRPREACGLFAVHGHPEAARLSYFGLYALQHRGQESAGISVSDGDNLTVYKDMGLVAQVFDETILAGLPGEFRVGHRAVDGEQERAGRDLYHSGLESPLQRHLRQGLRLQR